MKNKVSFRGKGTWNIGRGSFVYGYYFYDEDKDAHFIFNRLIGGAIGNHRINPKSLEQGVGYNRYGREKYKKVKKFQ
jgi:hypothetical protein